MMINVGELKGLIIQQALEGKLTRKLNAEDSKIYLLNNSINYSKYGPYDLPEKWYWVKCKDVCKLLGGFAFKSDNYSDSKDAVRVIRISDFNNDKLVDDEIKKYPYSNVLDAYEIFENDILMCMTGGTVGKTCLFPKLSYRCFLNQRVALFRTEHLEINYLYYVLKSANILKIINDTKRSTNDNISMKIIGEFDIPFPPLEEQKRIVEKLDEIFTELDKIDEKQTRLATIQEKMEAKILKLAIQGKLVEQRSEERTGEDLFKLIQEEKQELIKQGKIKKEKTLPAIEEDEVPFEIPSTWKWVRLGNLGDNVPYPFADGPFGSNLKREHYTKEKQVRIIQLSNVGESGWKGENEKYTTFAHLETIARSEVNNGDIVIAKMMPAGRAIIVPDLKCKFVLSSDCVKFTPNSRLEKEYLYYVINSDPFKKQVLSETNGIGRERTSLSKLKEYLIPLPPLEEQKRIVAKIEELLPLCRGNKI